MVRSAERSEEKRRVEQRRARSLARSRDTRASFLFSGLLWRPAFSSNVKTDTLERHAKRLLLAHVTDRGVTATREP